MRRVSCRRLVLDPAVGPFGGRRTRFRRCTQPDFRGVERNFGAVARSSAGTAAAACSPAARRPGSRLPRSAAGAARRRGRCGRAVDSAWVCVQVTRAASSSAAASVAHVGCLPAGLPGPGSRSPGRRCHRARLRRVSRSARRLAASADARRGRSSAASSAAEDAARPSRVPGRLRRAFGELRDPRRRADRGQRRSSSSRRSTAAAAARCRPAAASRVSRAACFRPRRRGRRSPPGAAWLFGFGERLRASRFVGERGGELFMLGGRHASSGAAVRGGARGGLGLPRRRRRRRRFRCRCGVLRHRRLSARRVRGRQGLPVVQRRRAAGRRRPAARRRSASLPGGGREFVSCGTGAVDLAASR